MDGGSKCGFKDCLQQSKKYIKRQNVASLFELKNSVGSRYGDIVGKYCFVEGKLSFVLHRILSKS